VPPSDLDVVFAYHDRTKHHPHRYARSLGYLDWSNQPDPFRRFEGAPATQLPFGPPDEGPALHRLDAVAPAPLDRGGVGRLFQRSLAITAWKAIPETRWALRANPSSGNLHPTESYAILPAVDGVARVPAIWHYRSLDHALELRCRIPDAAWGSLASAFPPGSFFVGFGSIHWRESWKYGERAFRYCQHDLGHAIAAVSYAAATLGWSVRLLAAPGDADVATLLGLTRDEDFGDGEREVPEAIVAVSTTSPSIDAGAAWPPRDALASIRDADWVGRANRLSEEQVEWEVIDVVARATEKPAAAAPLVHASPSWPAAHPVGPGASTPATTIALQRRSATAFDGKTALSSERFFGILDRTLPRAAPPFDAWPAQPNVHLAVFVNRVTGLDPGLYFLARDPAAVDRLRAAMKDSFPWRRVDGAPAHLPFFLLKAGDMSAWARSIACHQEIAADGAFSLGMLADFEAPCRDAGPWVYRRLFWETGVVGQSLYLEAEAAGMRGTGIGCFFDDVLHELLGLRGRAFQDLYHFAVGQPVDDARLTTLPAYEDAAAREA